MKKNLFAFFTIVIVSLPFLIYFGFFARNGIAYDQQQWAHFATFISAFAAIANLYVVYGLAQEAKELTRQGQEESRIYQDAYERPLLYLSQRLNHSERVWYITNIGRGAALNIRVSFQFSVPNDSGFNELVKCYALPGGKNTIVIDSPNKGIKRACVVYEDIRQRTFISVANNHETLVRELPNFSDIAFDDGFTFRSNDLVEIEEKAVSNSVAYYSNTGIRIFIE